MATGAQTAVAAALLASGVGSLVLTNAAPLSWAVASLSVWSTFVLASSKDGVRQSWLHVLWAYTSAAAFVIYLCKDPNFKVSSVRQAPAHLKDRCTSSRCAGCWLR